jgi:hypothetical protein
VSKVFISHSSSDDKVAIEIAHAVRRSGREVFYDRWSLAPGDSLVDKIETGAGIMRPNFLGGSTLVYHETGDPATLNAIFPNRGRGRALGLAFNFRPSGRGIPPHFVGYATRLPLSDWTEFVHCRYWLCFDVWSDGNAPSIQLEIKRLKTAPIEQSRQEIAKWQINLPQSPVWRSQSLRLADIQFPQASWDNLWEICLVLFRDRVAGDEGLVQVDDLRLARGPN